MRELEGFASRHGILSVELEKLYEKLSDNNARHFAASVKRLNDDICQLQREVMEAVIARSSAHYSPRPALTAQETRLLPCGKDED